ncbi:MAG: hypothetical protein HC797_08410 [Anaerolineales bacterium]|nr:hypothetical protein [Anaerolineales bacterium]
MQKTLVMKFGGTSVGSAEALMNVIQIVKDAKKDWGRIVIVTSANGRRDKSAIKFCFYNCRGNACVAPTGCRKKIARKTFFCGRTIDKR